MSEEITMKRIDTFAEHGDEGTVRETHIQAKDFSLFYGDFEAVRKVSMEVPKQKVTAMIGPSGCGKSTLLRSINRMNDLIPGTTATGEMIFDGHNIYAKNIDVVTLRARVGMVFQKPNVFPKSIFDNVAYGPRLQGTKNKQELAEVVEQSLRQAAIWGLGKTGLKAYRDILPFIDDEDENLALHAIAAFGEDTPDDVTDALVRDLLTGTPRRAAAASETLRIINNATVLESLIAAATTGSGGREWVLATLGRLPATTVKERLQGAPLLGEVKPLLLLNEEENWLCSEERSMDISFLLKQNI